MLTYPGFNPIAFELGPVKVHWYGIMYLLGFAGGWWLARRRAAKPGSTWKPDDVDDLIFFAMLGVIFGGRLGYVLFYGLKFWATDLWYPLKIWEGGMSFHGGLLWVVAALSLFAWRRRRNMVDVYDFTAPLPALGLFFGRLGNFINSELWGKVTTVPWGFHVELGLAARSRARVQPAPKPSRYMMPYQWTLTGPIENAIGLKPGYGIIAADSND